MNTFKTIRGYKFKVINWLWSELYLLISLKNIKEQSFCGEKR